jgi:hypothetical protein
VRGATSAAGGHGIRRRLGGLVAGGWVGALTRMKEEDKRRGWKQKKRNKWDPSKGHKSIFTLLFDTVSGENELKCHLRNKMNFRNQIGKKKINIAK